MDSNSNSGPARNNASVSNLLEGQLTSRLRQQNPQIRQHYRAQLRRNQQYSQQQQSHIQQPQTSLHGMTQTGYGWQTFPIPSFPYASSVDGSGCIPSSRPQPHVPGFSVPFGSPQPLSIPETSKSTVDQTFLPLRDGLTPTTSSTTWALDAFLNQRKDSLPWAANISPGASNIPQVTGSSAFAHYRTAPVAPSEYDRTHHGTPSDSGYGTGRPSFDLASVMSGAVDNSHETQSLAGRLNQFHVRESQAKPRYQCAVCGAYVKTKSDLNKHDQKHNKRHFCVVQGCDRSNKPFGTINDLERHIGSVHNFRVSGKVWKCTESECIHPGKLWPRADNFRSHLKRIHKIEVKDIKKYQTTYHSDNSFTSSRRPPTDALSFQSSPTQVQTQTARQSVAGHGSAFDHIPSPYQQPPPRFAALDGGPSILFGLDLSDSPYMDSTAMAPEITLEGYEGSNAPVRAELAQHLTDIVNIVGNQPFEQNVSLSTNMQSTMGGGTLSLQTLDQSYSSVREGASLYPQERSIKTEQVTVVGMKDVHGESEMPQSQDDEHEGGNDVDFGEQEERETEEQKDEMVQDTEGEENESNGHIEGANGVLQQHSQQYSPHKHPQYKPQHHFHSALRAQEHGFSLASEPSAFCGSVPDPGLITPIQRPLSLSPSSPLGLPSQHMQADYESEILSQSGNASNYNEYTFGHEADTQEPDLLSARDESRSVEGSRGEGDFASSSADKPVLTPKPASLIEEISDNEDAVPQGRQAFKPLSFPAPRHSWIEDPDRSCLMKFLDSIPRQLLKVAIGSQTPQEESPNATEMPSQIESQYKCAQCPKTFSRPCDLKKHAKRHEKPYYCTFRPCKKKFGSKNDWKRHETGQHLDVRHWKCSELIVTNGQEEVCKDSFDQRNVFVDHLQKAHAITDSHQIDARVDKSLKSISRFDPSFWCGFCSKRIHATLDSKNAVADRFDHIDCHFFGREGLEKKDISEWLESPPDSPLVVASAGPSVGKKRGHAKVEGWGADLEVHVPKRVRCS